MTETYRSEVNESVSNCIALRGAANHPTASFQDRVAALVAPAPEPALSSTGLAPALPALTRKRIAGVTGEKSATQKIKRIRDSKRNYLISWRRG
jgi:hypothetical protein